MIETIRQIWQWLKDLFNGTNSGGSGLVGVESDTGIMSALAVAVVDTGSSFDGGWSAGADGGF